jgi:hypothetical protein
MKDVVPADHLGLRVGEEGEAGISPLVPQLLAQLGRIDADREQANVAALEFGNAVFETPELGVT